MERVEIAQGKNGKTVSRIVLASPTYGPVYPRAVTSLRVAVMHAANNGITWVGDVSPDRMAWEAARNTAVKAALSNDAEGIMWVDSDMILPNYAITRLVNLGVDFASGMYFQRLTPFYPLVGKLSATDNFSWIVEWPENVVFQADGVGFGCAFTSTALLRRMLELEECKPENWFRKTRYSEDLSFCLSAAKVGTKPHVDTGILCGHLGENIEVTVEHFKTCNPYALKELRPAQMPVVGLDTTGAIMANQEV